MKLYYKGNQTGNLKYSLDGVNYINTSLENLKNGVALPENANYSKVSIKAGNNVVNSLDVLHDLELTAGEDDIVDTVKEALNLTQLFKQLTSHENGEYEPYEYDFYLGYCGNEYNTNDFYSGEIIVAFKNIETGTYRRLLNGGENFNEWHYVLCFVDSSASDYNYGCNDILDLGPIDNPFSDDINN